MNAGPSMRWGALPVGRWAAHVTCARLDVEGHAARAGGVVAEGDARAEVHFSSERGVEWVGLHQGPSVRAYHYQDAEIALDDLIAALGGGRFNLRARPKAGLRIRFGHGVVVQVPPEAMVQVTGLVSGAPAHMVLSEPLAVSFGEQGVMLVFTPLEALTRAASVRVTSFTLAPDGRVHLEGRGSRGFDTAVRAALAAASLSLTELIRRSPRWSRVRALLPEAPEG
ncbi:MAG: hypothetical protein JXX28_18240 [Deltaproteobacteria bacterium]|nr:hypothetical protein [Deltaproteobacteria bacterium]